MHILILHGQVTLWIVALLLVIIVSLLVLLPLYGNQSEKSVVSRSSAEVELRALATTTAEIIWLRWLLVDFGVPCEAPTPLLCDNTSAIQIANNIVKHELTKHIGVDASFIQSHC